MPKGCKSFAGMVNFLSMFCPELQKLHKPIYDLTRKGRPFVWGEEQQESFEQIKKRLVHIPVLHMHYVSLQWVVHYIRYRTVSQN